MNYEKLYKLIAKIVDRSNNYHKYSDMLCSDYGRLGYYLTEAINNITDEFYFYRYKENAMQLNETYFKEYCDAINETIIKDTYYGILLIYITINVKVKKEKLIVKWEIDVPSIDLLLHFDNYEDYQKMYTELKHE